MNYEEKYYELREKMCDAWCKQLQTNRQSDYEEYLFLANKFNQLCVEILEKLLIENSDILKRLKEI